MAHSTGQRSGQSNISEDEDDDATTVPVMSYFCGTSTLKPTFDAMLKEIEDNLPSLDGDDSDFEEGSGDEVEIFQRPEKYGQMIMEDADKDLDESLTSSELNEPWAWKALYSEKSSHNNTDANIDNRQETWDNENRDLSNLEDNNGLWSDPSNDNALRSEDNSWSSTAVNNSTQSWFYDSNRNADIQDALNSTVFETLISPNSIGPESLMTGINLHEMREPRMAWQDVNDESPPPTILSPQFTSPRDHTMSSEEPRHGTSRLSRRDTSRAGTARAAAVQLSLGSLNSVDLDVALQTVVEGEYRRHQRSRSSSLDLFDLRPGDNVISSRDPNKQTELMQHLVTLSAKQSGRKMDIDPMSGADRQSGRHEQRKCISKYEADAEAEKGDSVADRTATIASDHGISSSGTSTGSNSAALPKVMAARPKSERFGQKQPSATDEPVRDTVFLDLRKSERLLEEERNRQAIVQRVLKIHTERDESNDSSSESSAEDDRDCWFEHRRRIRQAIERGEAVPPPPNRVKVKIVRRTLPLPQRVANMAAKSGRRHTLGSSSDSTSMEEEDASLPSAVSQVEIDSHSPHPESPHLEPLDTVAQQELEKQREKEEQKRKIRKEAEKLFAAKKALLDEFESNKPPMTIDDKRRAAPVTPKLYHMVASHEPAPWCLPCNLDEQEEAVLLTVNLSSNGEIMPRRSSSSTSIMDKGGCTNSYYALVAWLCSLIPANVEQLDPPAAHSFPFHVLGLQQMFINGKLVLAVSICPTKSGFENANFCCGGKGGKKGPKETPFVKFLHKFFASKSLDEVCTWLHNVEPCSRKASGDDQFRHHKVEVSSKPMATFVQVQTNADSVKQYFKSEIGFHWCTVTNEEQGHYVDDDPASNIDREADINNTIVLLHQNIYTNQNALHLILERVHSLGFDISGLRLASTPTSDGKLSKSGALLVLGIRGTYARPLWLEELGPMDPTLAKAVAPNSLNAQMGGDSRGNPHIFTPRNPVLVEEDLARWFGGRIPDSQLKSIIEAKGQKVKFSKDSLDDSFSRLSRLSPVSLLTATASADIFLVMSPLVPPRSLGVVITIMRKRGFLLRGIRRRRLNQRQISALGIHAESAHYYLADYSPTSPRTSSQTDLLGRPGASHSHPSAPRPATLLLFSKENALHHASSALKNILNYFIYHKHLDEFKDFSEEVRITGLLHATPYSDTLLTQLGREFTRVPDLDSPATTSYIAPRLHHNPELEQISVLALVGSHMANGCYSYVMARILGTAPPELHRTNNPYLDSEGLELLGVKWLPALNSAQAKELTPYEVGQGRWRSSVKQLSSEPALISVFRGVDCAARIKKVMNSKMSDDLIPLDRMISSTPEYSYRLASLFFFDRELFSENSNRTLMVYLPPLRSEIKSTTDNWDDDSSTTKSKRPRSGKGTKTPPATPPLATKFVEESIFKTMQMGPRPIVTVLIIKPSILAKRNLAKLLGGIFLENFIIIGMRLVNITEIEAACMQTSEIRKDDQLYREDLNQMTSGASLVLALSRENAIKKLLDILGPEDPKEAKLLDPFLWRGMYGSSLVTNGFYASTSYESAVADLKQFFVDGVCCKATVDLKADGVRSPGVDGRLSARNRIAKEQSTVDPGPYNLARLNEVNCIVMLPPLVRLESDFRSAKFTDVIHCLQTMEVSIVGARMIWLTEEQAQDYLHVIDAGTFSQVQLLCAAPILVLAIQCNHAVISFNYMMEMGMLKIRRKKEDYMKFMQTGKDVAAAGRMLAFFFEELIGDDCKLRICEKQSVVE